MSRESVMHVVRLASLFATLVLLILASTARAEDPVASATKTTKGKWEGLVSLGGVGSAGNTESESITAGIDLDYRDPKWEWILESDGKLVDVERQDGQGEKQRLEDYEIDSHLQREIGRHYFSAIASKWDHEPSNDVSETHIGPGLGIHLIRSKKASLSVQAGLAYSNQRVLDAPEIHYGSIFLQPAGEWALPSHATLTWTGDMKRGYGARQAFTSDQEVDLQTPLAGHLSLKVSFEWEYDGRPAAGLKKNDLGLTVSLAVKPWGR